METDYTELDCGKLMEICGDNAKNWAEAFMQHLKKLRIGDFDQGYMIGWFANAIETAFDVRTRKTDKQQTEVNND